MAPGGEDILGVFGLLLIQLAEQSLAQDFGEADDRVERRAQLMGHVGEEFRLVPVRRFDLPALSSISRNSRAFWIANTDWVAKVFKSSITSGRNSPVDFRRTTKPPMIRSSRSNGTARLARKPKRSSNCRMRGA